MDLITPSVSGYGIDLNEVAFPKMELTPHQDILSSPTANGSIVTHRLMILKKARLLSGSSCER